MMVDTNNTAKKNILTIEEQRTLILNAYKGLLRDCSDFLTTNESKKRIRETFEFCQMAHSNMVRKSGEPYILHPIGVARIVAKEIGLKDPTSIAAALLHDVVEDTDYKLPYIEEHYGYEIAKIVDGLTKINHVIDPNSTYQSETFRKMLLTMSNDVRVAFIKIADRLHNMRTIKYMKPDKQLKIASETVFLYAPLAHRLGLYAIKSELEDLSLEITDNATYNSINKKLQDTKAERDKFIHNFIKPLKEKMQEIGIQCQIKGRVKSISSILKKIQKQNIPFEDIFDIFAVRIVIDPNPNTIDDREECWKAYNAISQLYRLNSERLRDWISTPKTNGYEALHTTVLSKGSKKWVEVQIRTRRMDYAAEKGVAAHWKYKEGEVQVDTRLEMWLERIRDLLENEDLVGGDFYKEFKSNIVSEQIYIFTPKGELKILPANATVLDFAYEVHTSVGNNFLSAKVNSQIVPLSHPLQNGDLVEVVSAEKLQVKPEWVNYVTTHRARKAINDELKMSRKKFEIAGKKIFDRKAEQLSFSVDHVFVKEFLLELNINTIEDLYYLLGSHKISMSRINNFIAQKIKVIQELKEVATTPDTSSKEQFEQLVKLARGVDSDALVIQEDFKANSFVVPQCCNPIPGDAIVGFTEKKSIIIHRTNCAKAIELMTLDGSKIVKAQWSEASGIEFLAGIKITGIDRFGLLRDIIKVISNESHINIRSITFDTFDGFYIGNIKLYVRDVTELDSLMSNLLKIHGVEKLERTKS